MQITIIGSGQFGQALAHLLLRNNHQVTLYTRDKNKTEKQLKIRSLSGVEAIKITENLPQSLQNTDAILLTTSFSALDEITQKISPIITNRSPLRSLSGVEGKGDLEEFLQTQKNIPIINCTKGLNTQNQTPHKIIEKNFTKNHPYASLSGPNFANEIEENHPTITTLATQNMPEKFLQKIFSHQNFQLQITQDILGTELCGALKNIYAIGMGYQMEVAPSANHEAKFFTQSYQEYTTLIQKLGGQKETLQLSCGIGDFFLTLGHRQSRNFRFGSLLGQKQNPQTALQKIGTVEGYHTLKSIKKILGKNIQNYPILNLILKECQLTQ